MSKLPSQWIVPEWNAAPRVRALITTRSGGFSDAPWNALNLGLACGDEPRAVMANRALLRSFLPQEPRWLKQVHGVTVVDAEQVVQPPEADASTSVTPGVVAVVMVADCLPVLLADRGGRCVGVAHAGWRGLAAGVIQNTVRAMRLRLHLAQADAASEDAVLIAYLGPAIGPQRFEVGPEVRQAMLAQLPAADAAFAPQPGGKYLADVYALARMALQTVGVTEVYGGTDCTVSDPQRFFSYRRDGVTGRQAALVWLAE